MSAAGVWRGGGEDGEMAFPHLNPSGLGGLPEQRAREAPRQERSFIGRKEALAAPTSLFVTSGHWATKSLEVKGNVIPEQGDEVGTLP